jgi:hypothetical protein
MATNLLAFINFNGPEWQAIKRYLQQEKDFEVQKLIGASSHDDSNKHRGAIQRLDKLLNAERDANIASQQGPNQTWPTTP